MLQWIYEVVFNWHKCFKGRKYGRLEVIPSTFSNFTVPWLTFVLKIM